MCLGALRHEDNDRVRGVSRDLDRVGIGETKFRAGVFDDGNLHAETDTKVGGFGGTGPAGGSDHTFRTTDTETARDENTVGGADVVPGLVELGGVRGVGGGFEGFSFDPNEIELAAAAHGGVLEGLDDGEVGVVKLGVFANEGNSNVLEVAVLREGESTPFDPEVLALLAVFGGDGDGAEVQGVGKDSDEVLGF
jgi:hypothetical protein